MQIRILLMFAYTILYVVSQKTKEQIYNERCSLNTNCFKCSLDRNCAWSLGICLYTENNNTLPWFKQLSLCLAQSDQSRSDSKKYCKEVDEENQLPFMPRISKEAIEDDVDVLFCKWTLNAFNANREYSIEFKHGLSEANRFAIAIDTTNQIEEVTLLQNYSTVKKGIQSMTIYYYGSDLNMNSYKDFEMKIKDNNKFPYIVLIIVFLSLLISASVGLFFSIIMKRYTRKIKLNKVKKEREDKLKQIDAMLTQSEFGFIANKTSMETCMICLEPFEEKAIVCQFKCTHIYHYKCIRKWIEKEFIESKCPNCKQFLFKRDSNKTTVLEQHTVINMPSIQPNHNNNNNNNNNHIEVNQYRSISYRENYNSNNLNANYVNVNSIIVTNPDYNANSQRNLALRSQIVTINDVF